MLSYINLVRIKGMIWFRQMYIPGMRGAFMVLIVNLVIMLMIKVVAMRMAHEVMNNKKFIAQPVQKRLAHAHANTR
jgi:Tfp pilus assembly protein PilX